MRLTSVGTEHGSAGWRRAAGQRSVRQGVAFAVVALLVSACSVNPPRHGYSSAGGERVRAGDGSFVDDGSDGFAGDPSLDGGGGGGAGGATGSNGSSGSAGGTGGGSGSGPRGGTGGGGGGGGSRRTGGGGGGGGGPAGSTVGVTATSVTVSYSALFSGPNGQLNNLIFQGFETWRKDVNKRGGIYGREVLVKRVDHRGSPEGGIAACKEAESNGSFMVANIAAAPALTDCLDEARVPLLTSGVAELKPWQMVRTVWLEPDSGRLLATYAKSELGGHSKKVGVIHTSLPAQTAGAKGFVDTARARGVDVVLVQPVQSGQASFTSELLRLRDAGAEIVAIFAVTESIGILRDAKAIQYQPQFTGVLWCFDEFSTGAPDIFRGVKCLRFYPGTETESYQRFKQKAAEHGSTYNSTAAWAAYSVGLIIEKVLVTAGPDLTREAADAAFDRITGYDTQILPPLNHWKNGNAVGTHALFPVTCCNPDNTWKTLGPAKEEF